MGYSTIENAFVEVAETTASGSSFHKDATLFVKKFSLGLCNTSVENATWCNIHSCIIDQILNFAYINYNLYIIYFNS
ncbi:hypothetical protein BpHYR1_003703 [Brachionus plicatilis]|uniref:Uncharacterized protein n=1 Tax=Brachionus plicatilis TaxID=10195 RepID=A0A3M7RED6_BRAPC|nr:hypothetical protein BpHYR1_003703 [Brachionus plicatilis]